MMLQINGESHEMSTATTVAALVDELKLPAPAILIEHNGDALRREEWSHRPLAPNDRIEIIRIVAGG